MKNFLRMLLSTFFAAAVLYGLRFTYVYFTTQSMLGPTVDWVIVRCLAALAVVCVLLYLRCWWSLAAEALQRRKQEKSVREKALQGSAEKQSQTTETQEHISV